MDVVFNPVPRSTEVPVRPKSVAFLDLIKSGHAEALNVHDYRTCVKLCTRDRSILKQRYVGYPVSVPDLSKDAVDETLMRRSIHAELYDMTEGTAFRKYVFPALSSTVRGQPNHRRHHPHSN